MASFKEIWDRMNQPVSLKRSPKPAKQAPAPAEAPAAPDASAPAEMPAAPDASASAPAEAPAAPDASGESPTVVDAQPDAAPAPAGDQGASKPKSKPKAKAKAKPQRARRARAPKRASAPKVRRPAVRAPKRSGGRGTVGIDIEAGSVAATEVRVNGSVSVTQFGVAPLAPGAVRDGEVVDPEALGEAIKALFAEHKFSRDLRIGIANQKVAVRTIRLPRIEDKTELEAAVRFSAQDHIPMPLDRAVLDWQVIPNPPGDEGQHMDVVAVAARREMLSGLTDSVRHAGLRLAGIDHSSFALIRALAGATVAPTQPMDATADGVGGTLYCHLGDITNLAVARGPYCVFSRVLGFGIEGIAQSLAANSGLRLEHARQWLVHVGLDAPVEEIEGDPQTVSFTREALAPGVATLVDELRRSLEYYGTLEDSVRVDDVVVAGPGIAIPGLVDRLERELPVPLRAEVPEPLRGAVGGAAGRLTLSYGLGLEA